jgi:hypothetical protein
VPVGEKLVFSVSWQGIINVGTGVLEVKEMANIGGVKAYHFHSEATSSSFFDAIYKVRDSNDSWADAAAPASLVFEQHIKEGGYKRDRRIEYDHSKHTAVNHKGEVWQIKENAVDVLYALYIVRTCELVPGATIFIEVGTHKKNYTMNVKVCDREKITIGGRTYDTIPVEPAMQDQGIFLNKGGLKIWLTDDNYHLPVKMRSEISVGSITAELVPSASVLITGQPAGSAPGMSVK